VRDTAQWRRDCQRRIRADDAVESPRPRVSRRFVFMRAPPFTSDRSRLDLADEELVARHGGRIALAVAAARAAGAIAVAMAGEEGA
jgi:hypothetical protein